MFNNHYTYKVFVCYLLFFSFAINLKTQYYKIHSNFKQFWCVTAFTTAEEFHLEELQLALSKTNIYEPTCLYSGVDECAGEWLNQCTSAVQLITGTIDFRIYARWCHSRRVQVTCHKWAQAFVFFSWGLCGRLEYNRPWGQWIDEFFDWTWNRTLQWQDCDGRKGSHVLHVHKWKVTEWV